MMSFRKELQEAINHHSQENGCNTPDLVLANFLADCLIAFDNAVNAREQWYGREQGWRLAKEPIDMNFPAPSELPPPAHDPPIVNGE